MDPSWAGDDDRVGLVGEVIGGSFGCRGRCWQWPGGSARNDHARASLHTFRCHVSANSFAVATLVPTGVLSLVAEWYQ